MNFLCPQDRGSHARLRRDAPELAGRPVEFVEVGRGLGESGLGRAPLGRWMFDTRVVVPHGPTLARAAVLAHHQDRLFEDRHRVALRAEEPRLELVVLVVVFVVTVFATSDDTSEGRDEVAA